MKGWMYVTTDGSPDFRSDEFLSECPDFFSRNRDFIIRTWKIDTDDINMMRVALQGWGEFDPKKSDILMFCKRIGFDIENANRLRNGQ